MCSLPHAYRSLFLLTTLIGCPLAAYGQIEGSYNFDEYFGEHLGVGDFNGDGVSDLAVTARDDGGSVHIIYGIKGEGLSAQNNGRWNQNSPGIYGAIYFRDFFGEALAVGDFNGDGFDELAISESQSNHQNIVHLMVGHSDGLSSERVEYISEAYLPEGPDSTEINAFGQYLSAGDFDGDGIADLVASAAVKDVVTTISEDGFRVLYGTEAGLSYEDVQSWTQATDGAWFPNQFYDYYGRAMAVGDFNSDGIDDFGISASTRLNLFQFYPEHEGYAAIMMGSEAGLTNTESQYWTREILRGDNEALPFSIEWAVSLAVGNFDGDAFDDFVIGSPPQEPDGSADVLYGTSNGLTAERTAVFHKGQPELDHPDALGRYFAWTMVAGDFDGDGFDDVAISEPHLRSDSQGGSVQVLYGSETGLNLEKTQLLLPEMIDLDEESLVWEVWGKSLAAADFDGDGVDDLVIGAAETKVGNSLNAGAVAIAYGEKGFGLSTWRNEYIHKGRTFGVTVSTEPLPPATPQQVDLHAPYPNPFTDHVKIGYQVRQGMPMRLVVYDVLGREVKELVNGFQPAGTYRVTFDAAELPPGIYFTHLISSQGIQVHKMIHLK